MEQLMLYDDFCKGCIHARLRLICLHYGYKKIQRSLDGLVSGHIREFCCNREIGPEWKRLEEAREELDLENAVLYGKAKIIWH